MEMTTKDALLKIRKLLARATSANEHEAAIAARQAESLMRKFSIVREDLSLADVVELEKKSRATKSLPAWEAVLLGSVTHAYGCTNLFATHSVRGSGRVIIIGPKAQAELASYTWETLKRQMRADRKKLSQRFRLSVRETRIWSEAWIAGVIPKINALALPFNSELAEQYVSKVFGNVELKKRELSLKVRKNDRNAKAVLALGYHAGTSAELLTPVRSA
jgi:Protein of unknown function (DUF2786)